MAVSDITVGELKEYLRAEETDNIGVFLDAAKAYVMGYTGMTALEVDTHADIVPVVYVLVADMYDNRQFAQSANTHIAPNLVAKTTLDMYCKNLL